MGTDTDDVFHSDQCTNGLWQSNHSGVIFQERGSILLAAGRIFAFLCILLLHNYNRNLLRSKASENMNVIPGLILPYYFSLIYLYIVLSLIGGVLDLIVAGFFLNYRQQIYNWVIPFEQAIFHWFYEGIAFFLMRYGAGLKAIKRSLVYSGAWAAVTFLFYFLVYCYLRSTYSFKRDSDAGYALVMTYCTLLLVFYTCMVVVPKQWLFRRSALRYYSLWNIFYYSTCLIISSVAYYSDSDIICPTSVLSFFYIAFVQPYVLFKTLQLDSQYWQGLKPGKKNPLAEVWDHVDVETAQSMAEQIEYIGVKRKSQSPIRASSQGPSPTTLLPVLNYGLLDFDHSGFVAGGFSRVYFGSLRGERVAFKVLFAMELTPVDVMNFYDEAQLLHSLQHENVVGCKGVCVMPPALTMVLEYCAGGSLYDFLYKPVVSQVEDSDKGRDSDVLNPVQSSIQGSFPALSIAARESSLSDRGSITLPTRRGSLHSSVGLLRYSNHNNSSIISPTHRLTADNVLLGSLAGGGDEEGGRSTFTGTETRSESLMQRMSRTHRSSRQALQRTYDQLSSFFKVPPTTRGSSVGPGTGVSSLSPQLLVSQGRVTPLAQRIVMMRDAARAIAFLHSKGFLHCDIKSLNFLVSPPYAVKIADLGEARAIASPPTSGLPPIPARNWAPPEVLAPQAQAADYTERSEVYGLGIVLCEILTLELPFGDAPDLMTQTEWYERLVGENCRPQLPIFFPEELRLLLDQCLLSDPRHRPSAQEVVALLEQLALFTTSSSLGSLEAAEKKLAEL